MKNKTALLLSGIFLLLTVLLMAGGFLSLFAVKKSQEFASISLDVITVSRDIRDEMQKQFLRWKVLLVERNDSERFRQEFHAFSRDAQGIQNKLWNLKVMTTGFGDFSGRINSLSEAHGELSRLYVSVLFSEEGLRKDTAMAMREVSYRDEAVMKEMDRITADIHDAVESEIGRTNGYYFRFVNAVLVMMGLAVLGLTAFTILRVRREQTRLEHRVAERTRELHEANDSLHAEIEERKSIEEKLRGARDEVEKACALISISEQRYRLLVEGSDDIIFALDGTGLITSANKAMARHLHESVERLTGRHFSELIDSGSIRRELALNYVNEKLHALKPGDMPSQFKSWLRTPLMIEPREFLVRLECIESGGRREYLGKGANVYDDIMTDLLKGEWKKLAIGNSLLLVEEVSQRLTGNLGAIPNLNASGRIMIRIALREIIINAIEHGNLNITGEEKSAALERDDYFELIASRQADERYRDRKVEIEYALSDYRLFYRVTDQGEGFDTAGLGEEKSPPASNATMSLNGRGIQLARSIFDSVCYNERGNSVVLVRHFHSNAQQASVAGLESDTDRMTPGPSDAMKN